MKPMIKEQSTVAVLTWDGEVYLYAESLRFLAWKLRQIGCKVVRFGCARALDACTSFNSTNKNEFAISGRNPVCERCTTAQKKISSDAIFDVEPVNLQLVAGASIFLEDLKNKLTGQRKISDVLDMRYLGFSVCRIAFFDFAIATKLSHESILDAKAMERFIAGVTDQIKLLHVFELFREKHAVTHILYVNGNYSQNTLAREYFSKFGVVCLNVEPQLTSQQTLNKVMISQSRLVLEPDGLHPQMSSEECRANFSILDGAKVLKNFGARINGGDFNAYTSLNRSSISNEELGQLEGFLNSYSRIHSFFFSSEDELTPHIQSHGALNGGKLNSPGGFNSQADFALYFLNEAAKYPQIGFVIRLHPRMAVNKRDPFESEEHIRYKNLLAGLNLPDNVMIIYGDSKISSYYVVSKSDLVIIAWSTIGLESLLLGTPVVAVFPSCLMYPITSFSHQPSTQSELEEALFCESSYGVPQDEKLLPWMSQAFETQFFATAAPRSKGGLAGKIYRVSYRSLERMRMYNLIARLIDFLFLRNIRQDPENLLSPKKPSGKLAALRKYFLKRSLSRYREKYRALLSQYGK